ncbi:TPA: hypothetical protein DDW69_02710 [candidate division CPR2 bacterium]|uniref:Uncharacterized protein n=1 Tax=candidate division CPR2 bacterium GW2011_GWC1_41_48 TaxID=1618344 RepID=A0A0G0W880_UNCC2|nr:MAG: hypothetical protein UT47_C0003G0255 [candidate division CPR2 bacterium GW2011_GWC2_39_35]KKR28194.1 MAG: hypothetical protein UT59_C0033G0011 [candidate division CPR2 bacterium GW2011_GWD1_39_7]KKR29272.1 MAG: hypothetical protein UT60_C0004G0009 [candidate division CPR2 bacterium GW2011_GWD2_39_7]KKS09194.1 MAG: hypothetical protein UU65_C0003G0249 [candidate division CPR2 bacterium GW2011_GWC1_41_48]OGB60363.1 MAG: hypothetical protein A2Y27_03125 [candidate division CPR2 bacterium G
MIIFLYIYLFVVFLLLASFVVGSLTLIRNSFVGDPTNRYIKIVAIIIGIVLLYSFMSIFGESWDMGFDIKLTKPMNILGGLNDR